MHNTIFYYIKKKFITTAATTYKKSKQCQMLFRMKKCVPFPQANVHGNASFEELPKHPVHFISSPPTLFWTRASGQGDRVCQDAFVQGREVSMASDSTELSDTCNSPHDCAPNLRNFLLPVTVLKIHLHKELRPHMRELMNHVFLSKYHRNENILIQTLLPHPNLQPS